MFIDGAVVSRRQVSHGMGALQADADDGVGIACEIGFDRAAVVAPASPPNIVRSCCLADSGAS